MKILTPVTGKSKGFNMALSLQKADKVCVYDAGKDKFEWLDVDMFTNDPGNLCINIKRMGITAIITFNMSKLALQLFKDYGIEVIKAQYHNVKVNIDWYKQGMLKPLGSGDTEPAACAGACSSCAG